MWLAVPPDACCPDRRAVSLALLAHAFPGAVERTKALAAYGATIGASFAIGPAVGGALTSGLDWQWIFLINLPIGIACLVVTLTRVEESRDPRPRRVDWAGQLTLATGLFLLVLAGCAATTTAGRAHRSCSS